MNVLKPKTAKNEPLKIQPTLLVFIVKLHKTSTFWHNFSAQMIENLRLKTLSKLLTFKFGSIWNVTVICKHQNDEKIKHIEIGISKNSICSPRFWTWWIRERILRVCRTQLQRERDKRYVGEQCNLNRDIQCIRQQRINQWKVVFGYFEKAGNKLLFLWKICNGTSHGQVKQLFSSLSSRWTISPSHSMSLWACKRQ